MTRHRETPRFRYAALPPRRRRCRRLSGHADIRVGFSVKICRSSRLMTDGPASLVNPGHGAYTGRGETSTPSGTEDW
jgi:hypothetical protein